MSDLRNHECEHGHLDRARACKKCHPVMDNGVVLATKNGSLYTNAIVIAETEQKVKVLSDFGNILEMSREEIENRYTVPEWFKDYSNLDYPFPTVHERIQEQIEKLQKVLKEIV